MLEEAADGKPSKEQRQAERRQQVVFDRIFEDVTKHRKSSGFADPAAMF